MLYITPVLFSVCQFEHWGRTSAHKVSASMHHLIRLLTTDVFPFLYTSLHQFSVSINIFQYQGSLIQSQHALGEEGGATRSGRQSIRGLKTYWGTRIYSVSCPCVQGIYIWFNIHIFWLWKDAHTDTEQKDHSKPAGRSQVSELGFLALVIIKLCCLKSFKCYVCVCVCVSVYNQLFPAVFNCINSI